MKMTDRYSDDVKAFFVDDINSEYFGLRGVVMRSRKHFVWAAFEGVDNEVKVLRRHLVADNYMTHLAYRQVYSV